MSDISEIIDNAIISKNMQVKNNTLQYAKKVFTEQNKINTTNEKKIKSMSTWAVMGKIFLALDIIILLIIGGIIVLKIMK